MHSNLNRNCIPIEYFVLFQLPFYKMLNNHIDILFSLLYLLEAEVPKYEYDCYNSAAMKLKNIYLLKVHFTCVEIRDESFDLSTLFEKLISDIVVSVHSSEISWLDAVNKCETIAHLIGVKKEKMFAELINRVQNLQLLIQVASNMIRCESSPMAMCEIAITIMENIGNGCGADLSSSSNCSGFASMPANKNSSLAAVEALKLIQNLALNACINASVVDLLVPCAILNWISACYSLQLAKNEPQWMITPVYKPECIAAPSASTVHILKDFFNMFLNIAGKCNHILL